MADLVLLFMTTGPSVIFILVGLVWGKKIIEYFYDASLELKKYEISHNLEEYKTVLEQENKQFQNQLDTKLNEFNIRFSKLHEQRADIIRNLYVKMVELHSAMYSFTRTVQPIIKDSKKEDEARIERVNNAIHSYVNFYIPNKIYFSADLSKKMDNLIDVYWKKGVELASINRQFEEEGLRIGEYQEYSDNLREISDIVKNDFPILIEELEYEFRKILGVE